MVGSGTVWLASAAWRGVRNGDGARSEHHAVQQTARVSPAVLIDRDSVVGAGTARHGTARHGTAWCRGVVVCCGLVDYGTVERH